MTSDYVAVPGARLYTERAGDGPPLLCISGGGDAGMYEEVVPLLAQRYTVFTYDRRGNSRSRFTDPAAAIDVAAQAGDIVAILDHYGVNRAYVFGGSGGAIIALDILAHLAYQPDLPALRDVAVPWRLATGRDSVGKPYYRPAHVLAEKLGVPCEEFPGGHTVYIDQPSQFTEALEQILARFPG